MSHTVEKRIAPIITKKSKLDELLGVHLDESYIETLITYDADVYCSESGKCLAKFRKKVIPFQVQKLAYEALYNLSRKSSLNRGTAAGWSDEEAEKAVGKKEGVGFKRVEGTNRYKLIRSDGRLSNTLYSIPVKSSIAGYMDSSARNPYCRQTAFNQKHYDKFKEAYPIIKLVDNYYSELMPDHYSKQREEADKTAKDFVIKNTSFTTLTVNNNWQTAVHTDKGDYEEGFGNLVALRKGKYTGGHLVLPKWGVGFDLQNGDLLLMDVHEHHGNTPIVLEDPNATRISLVMYYRKNMIKCGSAKEELERVVNRSKGDKING